MIKAVVFDMDGIMFDTERQGQEAMLAVGKQLGMPDIETFSVECLGATGASIAVNFAQRYGHMMTSEEFWGKTRQYRKDRGQQDDVPLKTGLIELLDYLKEHGYKIAVATSTNYEKVMHNFDVTGVQGRFDAVVCGDMISRSKPAPDIYLRAAELLGVAPQECMALEDSPNGIRSGIAAGMYTVMIPDMIPATEELLAIASNKVDTLLDIMPLLDQLGSPEICKK